MKSAMKLGRTQPVADIRLARLAVLLFAVALLLSAAPPVAADEVIEFGYAGPEYPGSTGGNGEPTGEKPESKLWWNDGAWWASMWSEPGNAYHIFKLDPDSPDGMEWKDTGVPLDPRNDSRADVLWDGNKLYVASHVFAKNGGEPNDDPDEQGRLFRYSYDSSSKTYSLDDGFPVEITGGVSETLVLEKDANGKLWVTYVEDQKVMVNHSIQGDDSDWVGPYALPADDAENLSSDDISSIITYNVYVGIMWSNQQSGQQMYFAVHHISDPDQDWDQVLAFNQGDDHINLTSLETDGNGQVYGVVKTSGNDIVLLVCEHTADYCRNEDNWSAHTVFDGDHSPTRAMMLLDTGNDDLYVFSRNREDGRDAIYYKRTGMSNIQFDGSIGTPFIKSAEDDGINDPTSTKQNLSSGTGLVVLASDSGPDRYFYNYMGLSGSATKYNLTVSPVVGQGAVTLDPPGGEYDEGTTVSLTATPEAGWEFSGWSGDLNGTDNPATIVMNSDKAVTATFTQLEQYELTVNTDTGGSVDLDPSGGTYYEGTEVTLTATADSGWQFDGWSGAASGTEFETTVVMDGDKTVSAHFSEIPQYTLTVNTDTGGSVSLDPPDGPYDEGTEVELVAIPELGWEFSGWEGDLGGSENPATITMEGDRTVTANFTPIPQYTLTMNTDTGGSVSLDPSGGTYYEGTEVELEAIPDPGWEFSGWGGALAGDTNPETIVMDGDKTVTANFLEIPQYTLTVNTDDGGSVSLDPSDGPYDEGTEVELEAIPDSGWDFTGWEGDLEGSENPTTITMDGDKSVTAHFTESSPTEYTLIVEMVGNGSVTPNGGTYEEGAEVTLTATPDAGWQFVGWSGAASGTDLETTVVMDGDKTVTATFTEVELSQYTLTVIKEGSGDIAIDPPGSVFTEGQLVTLTATAATGWYFMTWTGDFPAPTTTNPLQIRMESDTTFTAVFSPIQRELNVTSLGGGNVTVDPPGGVYDHGTTVTLTANPDPGWTFNSWSGDLDGTDNPATITMDADKEINATFVQKETGIQIEVSARPLTATVGQVITYTYVVANIGEATLTDVVVVDNHLGAVTLDRTTLASGETAIGRLSYTPTLDDLPGPLQNKANVTGTSVLDEDVSDSDTISVAIRQLSFVYYMPLGFSRAPTETLQNVEQATRSGPERVAGYLAAPKRWTARR